MALYLTFDIGTTALKTALIEDDGRILGTYLAEYTPRMPQPDWAEMAPETYWQAAVTGARAVLSQAEADPAGLAAIGFSSQGQTFVALDAAGHPLHDAIVWTDLRAQEIAEEWEATWLSAEDYRHISGYPSLVSGLTLFKIAWLAQHASEAHQAWKFLCLPDYLIYRLTGETATDYNIAQMSGLFDLRTQDWHPKLLQAAGITADQLPQVVRPGTPVGRLRPEPAAELGLPAGVPVCVGCNDQLAGALGAGNVRPGIITETTGTALALIATTPELLNDTRMFVGRHAAQGFFYAMPYSATSAIVLKWFRDLCSSTEDYETFLAGVEAIPPGSEGLTVLPHFSGSGSPHFNPEARGAFVGLTLGHTRAHMARAIMEACACLLQECVELVQDHGLEIDSVCSLGGAAHSDLWLQIKADLLGLPVERPACAQAASLGAAMLAATGLGQFDTVQEAASAWYRPAQVFQPAADRFSVYREVYQRYHDTYHRLYGVSPPGWRGGVSL